jgi:hypothetical protein
VLLHKLRQAVAEEFRGRVIGGEQKVARSMVASFGGHVKPPNRREDRRDRHFRYNQSGKRKVVVIVRERGGIPSRQFSNPKIRPFRHHEAHCQGHPSQC